MGSGCPVLSKGSGLRYCVLVFFRPPHPGSHQPFTDRREYIPVGSTAAVPAADVRDRPLPAGLLRAVTSWLPSVALDSGVHAGMTPLGTGDH